MRKLVYGLLALGIVVGSVQAKVYTDKTFLTPGSHNENLAMEYATWHKQVRHIDENKWGGVFQATGFYQASTNDTDLGKYFGKYNNALGENVYNPYAGTIQDFIWVKDRYAVPFADGVSNIAINHSYLLLSPEVIFHDSSNLVAYNDEIDVKGTFRPKQTSFGLRLDYHQKLDKLTRGLYLKVTAPIVHVKNDMNVSYTGDQLKQKLADANVEVAGKEKYVTLADYLAGKVENTRDINTQSKLCAAKICGNQTKTSVADVDVTLGYNFLYKEHKHFGVNVCLTIPTNDTPDGEWLFEPVLGLAGHWALGLGIDGAFELWQHGKKALEFLFAANYKYVLNATEKRTLGFKYGDNIDDTYSTAGRRVPMGWYFLGGQVGKKGVFPLANVLTRDVGVEPGSQLEALASLAFNWGNFTFDLGYNLFAKEGENVVVKSWQNDTYAVANPDYNTSTAFALSQNIAIDGAPDAERTYRAIQKEDLIVPDASTPVAVTHKIFGGFGYGFNDWKYPLMLGLGGSWEFTQGMNSALDGYALWAKAGVTF